MGFIKFQSQSRKSIVAFGFVAVLFLGVFLSVRVSQQNQENRSRAAGTLVNPTHFLDSWFDWPAKSGGYSIFDALITPESDGSPDGYFFAHYFQFSNYSGYGGYLGLQTIGSAVNSKAAIFSVWDALSSTGPEIAQPFGGEGVGQQTMINYNWIAGRTYRLRVSRGTDPDTWEARVKDLSTGQETFIGNILVPANRGGLSASSAIFHERYSGFTSSCNDLKYSAVRFTNLRADNGAVSPLRHSNTTSSVCSDQVVTTDIQDGVRSAIGSLSLIQNPTPTATPTPIPTATPIPTIVIPTSTPIPTLTSTPIVTPAVAPTSILPTPTTSVNTTKVSLSLLFHGIGQGGDSANPQSGGNPTPLRRQRLVKIEVYNIQNQLVLSKDGTVNLEIPSGGFKGIVDLGNSLPSGVYTVKVKANQLLRALVPGIQRIIQGEINILPSTTLIAGDMNDDNKVNIMDYNLLLDCYADLSLAKNCSDPTKKQSADVTDDGSVNQFDYNLFLRELTNIPGE